MLLPSAYVNVSRTAASYAALLPNEKFLLVYARNSARLKNLPSNIHTTSLDSYFVTADRSEAGSSDEGLGVAEGRLIAARQNTPLRTQRDCSTAFRV